MKRKEPPDNDPWKSIRPVLYYPDSGDNEPTQVVMPSSPPLPPRSSSERAAIRNSRKANRSDFSPSRRRSALDNIGYEAENIPTPRAPLLFTSTQSSPSKGFYARIQPKARRTYSSTTKLLSVARRITRPASVTTDPDAGLDNSSEYIVDSSDGDSPVATTSATQLNSSATSHRPISPRAKRVSEHLLKPKPKSTPAKRVRAFDPNPTDIIVVSSSESDLGPPSRETESPTNNRPLSHHRDLSPSSDVIILDAPVLTIQDVPNDESEDVEIEVCSPPALPPSSSPLPRPSTLSRRRIITSPTDDSNPFRLSSPSTPAASTSRKPWRLSVEQRKRPLAPEFMPRSNSGSSSIAARTTRPPILVRDDVFTVQETSRRSISPLHLVSRLSKPPLAPLPKDNSQAHAPTRARVFRMECVLVPKASRATLMAMARFDRAQSLRTATNKGKEKGKGRMKFVVEIPAPPKKRGRKSGGGGLGKGKGKGSYAAREEGRWDSSSPAQDTDRDGQEEGEYVDVDADVESNEYMGRDEVEISDSSSTPGRIEENEYGGFLSADSEPEVLPTVLKTPLRKKRERKPEPRKTKTPNRPPRSPHEDSNDDQHILFTRIELNPLADVSATYESLPRELEDSAEKYCHCCRTLKKGKLKMRCTNEVTRTRRGYKKRRDDGRILCDSWWCQRCVLKHQLVFDVLEEFTCPMCNGNCVCDKCRRGRGLKPLGKLWNSKNTPRARVHRVDIPDENEDEQPLSSPSLHAVPEDTQAGPSTKGPGYAEQMRQRGPTTWHGRRTPPPLRHRHGAMTSTNDVFVPLGLIENGPAEEGAGGAEVEPRASSPLFGTSPLATSRENTPVESRDSPRVEPELSQTLDPTSDLELDFTLGGNPTLTDVDSVTSGLNVDMSAAPRDELSSGTLAIEMDELLLVDQLVSTGFEGPMVELGDDDDVSAMNEAILGLGPATLVDNDAILAGLDANMEDAYRHFYGAGLSPTTRALYDATISPERRRHHQQMRFGNVPDVMLAGDLNMELGVFGDRSVHSATTETRVMQEYLGELDEAPMLSLAPATLSRSPTCAPVVDPAPQRNPVDELSILSQELESSQMAQAGPVFPQPDPKPNFNVDHGPVLQSQPGSCSQAGMASVPGLPFVRQVEPESESEALPDLTTTGSAKSAELETPSPDFDVDGGLESADLDLSDLFGDQDLVRFDQLDQPDLPTGPLQSKPPIDISTRTQTSVSNVPDELDAPHPSSSDAPYLSGLNGSDSAPSSIQTANVNDTPDDTSIIPSQFPNFVLPVPEHQAQLRASLERRFQTRSMTSKAAAEAESNKPQAVEGRITRSRSRRYT